MVVCCIVYVVYGSNVVVVISITYDICCDCVDVRVGVVMMMVSLLLTLLPLHAMLVCVHCVRV